MFRLLETFFSLNIKQYIYIYVSAVGNLLQSEHKTVYIYIYIYISALRSHFEAEHKRVYVYKEANVSVRMA